MQGINRNGKLTGTFVQLRWKDVSKLHLAIYRTSMTSSRNPNMWIKSSRVYVHLLNKLWPGEFYPVSSRSRFARLDSNNGNWSASVAKTFEERAKTTILSELAVPVAVHRVLRRKPISRSAQKSRNDGGHASRRAKVDKK